MKLFFIDIDNTLLDFDAFTEQALANGFKHFSLPLFDKKMIDVFHKENDILWTKLEKGELSFDALKKIRFQRFFDALGISFSGEEFETYYRSQLNESAIEEKHAREMLAYLSKKYLLAAASNGPYQQQMHRLSLAKMDHYFSYFFISEKVGYSKPSGSFFKKAFEEINLSRENMLLPKESCIIGDSLSSDMQGGINYRLKTCFYNKKGISKINIPVDYVVKDLKEVISLF